MGFTGKLAIHPAQVAPVNSAFMPTGPEVEQAQSLLAAARGHAGAFRFDDRMVDVPHVRRAERTGISTSSESVVPRRCSEKEASSPAGQAGELFCTAGWRRSRYSRQMNHMMTRSTPANTSNDTAWVWVKR